MSQKIVDSTTQEMEKNFQYFSEELKKIRLGRASANLVADLMIDYYGTKTPLKQLATITCPDPKMIVITPFDKNSMKEIEKTISQSNQGLVPQNDGKVVRVVMPPLTEERRQMASQMISQKFEETKVKFREARENGLKESRTQKESGAISEDDFFKAKKSLDEVISEFNKRASDLSEKKIAEVMQV